jgi:hypothetical protein
MTHVTDIDTENFVKVYPGNFRKTSSPRKYSKVIVFDLDETLGYFSDLVTLWNVVGLTKTQNNFNKLLDLYPEFLRHGILTIIEYLYHKKTAGLFSNLYLYTNNKYSPEIPRYIAKYFDYKMGILSNMETLSETYMFDKVICAFKIGNRIIEPSRTTHKKTHSDFIKCTLLPKNTEICFIDDAYHSHMETRKIYYIQPFKYYHNLDKTDIIHRAHGFMPEIYNIDYLQYLFSKHYKRSTKDELYIHVSQKIMYHIKEFFYLTTTHSKTRKTKTKMGRFTRKR